MFPPLRSSASPGRAALVVVLLGATATASCGGGAASSTAPAGGAPSQLVVTTTLPALDASRDGSYEVWVTDAAGATRRVGRLGADGAMVAPWNGGIAGALLVTLEPPAGAGAAPSAQTILTGAIAGTHASLSYVGAVTQSGLAMRETPGQFTMFTPSDNGWAGYPSHEESGVWLFNMAPSETPQKDYYVRLAQLQSGWTYEGWMVRDIGTPAAVWLSYGKFLPDWTGAVNEPDDTGWGPFSGVADFRTAQLEDFPGDDWICNPLGYPWSPALKLPLDLREKDAAGKGRWSHVITVEPARDRGEPLTSERPFVLRPYVDPFGDGGPGVARALTFRPAGMPSGSADLR